MAQKIDLSKIEWITRTVERDPNGPVPDESCKPYDPSLIELPLIEVIARVARRCPDQIAVDDGVMQLSYAQLYAMTCRLSHAISAANLPPGAIGIKTAYDALHTVAILGCLAAGRPSLLMNRDHPPDYIHRLIEAADLKGLIVNTADARYGEATGGPALIAIEPALMSLGDSAECPTGRLNPDEPALIVPTSGSTGAPKLVAYSQRRIQLGSSSNIANGCLTENDRFLHLGNAAGAVTINRNLLPLLIGGRLHIVDLANVGISGSLKAIRDQKITFLRTTVSIMKAIAQVEDAGAHLGTLRALWIGGEMMMQKDLELIRAVLPRDCRIAFSLSSTETQVARWYLPERDDHDPVRVAAGYLYSDLDVALLGEDGRSVAPGEIGELIVRSRSVALGEWVRGRVVATDRFQIDPDDPTKRIYRMGDMARLCPDGILVVHGRKDRMIKIRGQRVEPAIVEGAIRDVPGVADAMVAAKHVDGDVSIHGFVVPQPQASENLLAELNGALERTLPSYMWPSSILIVKSFPLITAGKVDVRALLAMLPADKTADQSSTVTTKPSAPVNAASERSLEMVRKAWRAAFRKELGGAERAFNAAGGDSLQFMQIVFRLEQLSGASIPLDALDVSMTQRDMASRLDDILGGGITSPPLQGKQVFLFPGVGGDEPRLLQFRSGCAPELSMVVLPYGDWTQWVEPEFRLETIVDRLVARIQESAPTGPLSLSGYSFGGRMVLIVAARLLAAGRQIENLLLLDTRAIARPVATEGAGNKLDRPTPTLRQELGEWRRAIRRGEGTFIFATIVARHLVRPRWAFLMRWLSRHYRKVLPSKVYFYLGFCLSENYLEQAADWRRQMIHIPRLSIPITVFLTSGLAEKENPSAGWSQYFSEVAVVPIGGDHFTMFDPPNLSDLCAHFKAACAGGPMEKTLQSSVEGDRQPVRMSAGSDSATGAM